MVQLPTRAWCRIQNPLLVYIRGWLKTHRLEIYETISTKDISSSSRWWQEGLFSLWPQCPVCANDQGRGTHGWLWNGILWRRHSFRVSGNPVTMTDGTDLVYRLSWVLMSPMSRVTPTCRPWRRWRSGWWSRRGIPTRCWWPPPPPASRPPGWTSSGLSARSGAAGWTTSPPTPTTSASLTRPWRWAVRTWS